MNKRAIPENVQFGTGTPPEVKRVLLQALQDSRRVRLFEGDQATGRDWGEENMVMGYVGHSTGSKPILLLISNQRSTGGGGIQTAYVLKVVDIATHQVLYQHPTYRCPTYTVKAEEEQDMRAKGYVAEVLKDGELYARCRTYIQAERLAGFLRGDRFSK